LRRQQQQGQQPEALMAIIDMTVAIAPYAAKANNPLIHDATESVEIAGNGR